MIPKKIHYCWFGGNPLPEIAIKCMESWQKFCPDYELIRWDESSCDMTINQFVEQAYESKNWAFVSDYFRLKVVEEHGGIYLDIDVELLKPLDDLLDLDGFMGFELGESNCIATGLGFGAVVKQPTITKLRENYENIPFIKDDGSFDITPCPLRDTKLLVRLGLEKSNKKQEVLGITFFPSDYFSPIGFMGERCFTGNTYSIHHFNGSWFNEDQKLTHERHLNLRKRFGSKFGLIIHYFLLAVDVFRDRGIMALLLKLKDFKK